MEGEGVPNPAASQGAGDMANPADSNPETSGLPGPALEAIADPNVVDKLIDELKSQGMFDQIRKDCLDEVDTKVSLLNVCDKAREQVYGMLSNFPQSLVWIMC